MNKTINKIIKKLLPNEIKEDFFKIGQKRAFVGDNVTCPCCNKSFIAFLPAGIKKRPHAQCPGCYSFERHRLLWMYLIHKTNLFKEKVKVLHIAPEPLFFTKFKGLSNIEYTAGAKFGEGYEDEYPAGTIDIDLTDIQLSDSSFDVILCSHVLEHIPNDLKAMQELYRVLKPGGWAILQVPLDSSRDETYEDASITDPVEREKAFGQKDHVRVYGNDYTKRLETVGFKVKRDNYIDTFSDADIFRYGFMKGEDIFYCVKD